MSVVKPTKGVPQITTVGGGGCPASPVLDGALARVRREEELILLEELKRERDPWTYRPDAWWRYTPKCEPLPKPKAQSRKA